MPRNIVHLRSQDLWTMLADLSAGDTVRIHTDEHGLMYSVDHGMWSPPMGQVSDNIVHPADEDDEPYVLEPCDHVGAGVKFAPFSDQPLCVGCEAEL